jgi:hypothetical protein
MPIKIIMPREARRISIGEWARVDSNHRPTDYESAALTS